MEYPFFALRSMRNRFAVHFVSAAAIACLPLLAPPARAAEDPIRIICIGDSITQGGKTGRAGYTYRLPLQRLLKENEFTVDFIGTRRYGLHKDFKWPIGFDPDHEGFYGENTRTVQKRLEGHLLRLAPPDIAIIHLGTNDQRADNVFDAIVPPLTRIVRQLRTRNPRVKVLIAQIPGTFKNALMHVHVWLMARRLSSEVSPVRTVPVYWIWETDEDTFDGAHPNPSGQEKLAEAFFASMRPFLERVKQSRSMRVRN